MPLHRSQRPGIPDDLGQGGVEEGLSLSEGPIKSPADIELGALIWVEGISPITAFTDSHPHSAWSQQHHAIVARVVAGYIDLPGDVVQFTIERELILMRSFTPVFIRKIIG